MIFWGQKKTAILLKMYKHCRGLHWVTLETIREAALGQVCVGRPSKINTTPITVLSPRLSYS